MLGIFTCQCISYFICLFFHLSFCCAQARQADRYPAGYPDMSNMGQEIPALPSFSASLTSTSPHLSGQHMMALIDQRRGGYHAQGSYGSQGGGGGSVGGAGAGNDDPRGFVFNNAHKVCARE